MVTTELTAQPIPTPADFPVGWVQPEDERLFWQTERMHWPDLLTPMDFAILRAALDQLTWSFASYGVPLAYSARHINYRWYFSVNPNVDDLSLMPTLMQTGIPGPEGSGSKLHWSEQNQRLTKLSNRSMLWIRLSGRITVRRRHQPVRTSSRSSSSA